MNFVERIINAGFVEQVQLGILNAFPEKAKWIPNWWESYNPNSGWLGVCVDHPDAMFTKAGTNKKLILSLQGIQTPNYGRWKAGINTLFRNMSVRYICLKVDDKILYESFSGTIPPDSIINKFLND